MISKPIEASNSEHSLVIAFTPKEVKILKELGHTSNKGRITMFEKDENFKGGGDRKLIPDIAKLLGRLYYCAENEQQPPSEYL